VSGRTSDRNVPVDGRLKTIWKDFTALWYIVSVCDKPLTCDKLLGLCDNPVAVIG